MPDIPSPPRLTTPRLEMVALDADLSRQLIDPGALALALGLDEPEGWPPDEIDAEASDWLVREFSANPASIGWYGWLVLLLPGETSASRKSLIGFAGFKGPPTDDGRVDVGYSILDAHQRKGYATESLGALVRCAFADPCVSLIVGETYETLPASIRVMEKCGFRFVGVQTGFGGEENVRRYELPRDAAG